MTSPEEAKYDWSALPPPELDTRISFSTVAEDEQPSYDLQNTLVSIINRRRSSSLASKITFDTPSPFGGSGEIILPQTYWKSFPIRRIDQPHHKLSNDKLYQHNKMASFGEKELSELKKLRIQPTAEQKNVVTVSDLKPGDVILVQAYNAVALSQNVTRVFSQEVTRSGTAHSVHCMIVTCSNGLNATVAHVTRDGGCEDFIEDPMDPEVFRRNGMEPPEETTSFDAIVYRLDDKFKETADNAAAIASELVQKYQISYATNRGLQSVFRDPRVGKFLVENKKKIFEDSIKSEEKQKLRKMVTSLSWKRRMSVGDEKMKILYLPR